MDDSAPEQARATKRTVWLVLTLILTFVSGVCAAIGNWSVVSVTLGFWIFSGIILAASSSRRKRFRQ